VVPAGSCVAGSVLLLQSVGWLENLGVVGTAGAGAVTEMEVLLLHSAWFRLEAVCRLEAFLLLQSVGWLENLGVVGTAGG